MNKHLKNIIACILNSVRDKEAEKYHSKKIHPNLPTAPNDIQAEFYNKQVTTKNMNILHTLHHAKPYLNYLTNKFKWNPYTPTLVDWHNLEKFKKTLDVTKRVNDIKYSHKWRPTQQKLHQIDFEGSDCPS